MSKSLPFRFKQFEVRHSRSSMKVGVDGVLVGCWAHVEGSRRILDIGTGCGVVALICAQRNKSASVLGIDIDPPSVEEATLNFASSPFAARMEARLANFLELDGCFDAIVSNPPFFDSGLSRAESAREIARHEVMLPLSSLVRKSAGLLHPDGKLTLILPYERYQDLVMAAQKNGMACTRLARVKGHPTAPVKRILAELKLHDTKEENVVVKEEDIVIMAHELVPTDTYRNLTKDFYLRY